MNIKFFESLDAALFFLTKNQILLGVNDISNVHDCTKITMHNNNVMFDINWGKYEPKHSYISSIEIEKKDSGYLIWVNVKGIFDDCEDERNHRITESDFNSFIIED